MSRCFPYPPPGYLVKRDNSDALIESIKLPSLTEKAKAERKAEKKEKRDKKEKKHHDKKDKKHHDKKHKRSDVKQHKETAYLKGKSLLNGGEEAEQRSGVTEERGPPAMPSYSSDSTENSNKRRRPDLPEYGISSSGSTLRIRFKRKEAEPIVANEKPLAPINSVFVPKKPLAEINAGVAPKKPLAEINSGLAPKRPLAEINAGVAPKRPVAAINAGVAPKRPVAAINAGAALKQVDSNAIHLREQQASTSARNEVARPDIEQVCSTSGMRREAIAPVVPHVSKKLKSVSKRYNELFENWVPLSLLNPESDDDQDWLFQRKEKKQQERPKVEGVTASGCSLSSTWPCAQFLQEVDVYALPFTVPY